MSMKTYALAAAFSLVPLLVLADSMERWKEAVLPKSYPKLLQLIEADGPVTVRWRAQSGDVNTVVARLSEGALIISTEVPIATIAKDDWIDAEIADTNLDGHPDRALYDADGDAKLLKEPLDEASKFTWYSSIATIFRQTGCCR